MEWTLEHMPWLPSAPEQFRSLCKALGKGEQPWAHDARFLANHSLDAPQLIRFAKALKDAPEDKGHFTPFRLGYLSNATTDLIAPCIAASAARYGILAEMITAPFDQVFQQAMDPNSELNHMRPDAVLLALDHRGLPLEQGVDAALEYVNTIRSALRKHSGAPLIVQNIARPPEPMFGHLDRRIQGNLQNTILQMNVALETTIQDDYLLDVAGLAESVGLLAWHDLSQWYTAKLPFAQKFVPLYAEMVARLIGAVRGKTRKCLVLDLDNTLWGGVIGDDGIGGIALGQGNPKGEAFLAIQRMALSLRERGIILAVSSKNNNDIARTPFREHPDMLLKEDHIAVFQANWEDKASNIKAIAKTLNIGTDALVFLDDNPAERSYVRGALPEVGVPELPSDPAFYPRALLFGGYFETVAFSEEDRIRADTYQANAQRAQLEEQVGDVGVFLKSLDMRIHFAPFNATGRARIAQLVNKSNQFNLTTRRYSESDVAKMESDPAYFTMQVRLADHFGDNGMISVIICRDASSVWDVDTWVMICRRRVEEAVLAQIATAARRAGKSAITGTFIDSKRNGLVRDHYHKLGFSQTGDDDAQSQWRLELSAFAGADLPFAVSYENKDELT
jgi:FkbH-like protein